MDARSMVRGYHARDHSYSCQEPCHADEHHRLKRTHLEQHRAHDVREAQREGQPNRKTEAGKDHAPAELGQIEGYWSESAEMTDNVPRVAPRTALRGIPASKVAR